MVVPAPNGMTRSMQTSFGFLSVFMHGHDHRVISRRMIRPPDSGHRHLSNRTAASSSVPDLATRGSTSLRPSAPLIAARSTAAPPTYTAEIFRWILMSSSGLASSTTKSALLPAATVPRSSSRSNCAALCVASHDDLCRRHPGRYHVGHLEMMRPRHSPIGAHRDEDPFLVDPRKIPAPGCRTTSGISG